MRKIPIYSHPAAGWPALISSTRKLMDYQTFLRGSVSVFKSNQPQGGFDCPGCAWPDHKSHKAIDVCENGIKVIASETMTKKADAQFFARHTVTELQGWSGYELEHSGRLSEPMYYDAAQDRYVPITWEAAYGLIAEQFGQLGSPDEALFYTSGRVTNEPAFLFQLFVRCFGTNNLPDCSNMCHEPTSVMLSKQLGIGKATVKLEDFEQAKLILMFGQNPATNHPRMLEMLAHAHEQGCRILSINPMREQGLNKFRNPQKPTHMAAGQSAKMVDDVIQIQIGGDAALLTGIAKWLIANDKINHDFITTHTSGFEPLKQWLTAQSWADITLGCGISQTDIINLAELVAESPATICTWGMGITQHVQGDDNVAMITNLLLLMGMIGIDGAGASPVRGHSNVQGDRTMGIHERPSQSLLDSLERVFEHPMPQEHGYDVVTGAKALIAGKLKVFMGMGGNYAVAAPDTSAIEQALTTTQLNIFVGTKLNETMLYPGANNLILPCLGRTERIVTTKGEQFATIEDSMCQVVPTQGTLKPVSDTLKSEAQIVADIATHVLGADSSIPWLAMSEDFDVIRDYIAQAINGFEDFNQRIRTTERGFHLYHAARHRVWNTQSGKAQFEVPEYPITFVAAQMADANDVDDNKDTTQKIWQLTSVRSHDQFNTMIFGFKDRYRQTDRRDVLFMHPDEISRLGWQKGDRVMVTRQRAKGSTEQPRILGPLVLTEMDIASNAVAAYYPECNDLFDLDTYAPDSHIPAYKSTTVVLERVEANTPIATPA
ncbi:MULTISPECIES: FdhF/YdeP family oxidoreductase [unclassified Psychrobacter]|uniref:FdhF/YdeP family oxidoreductase n=1 Tax=unclassified Psychrobacter TaxID=196806 RepID=UPI0025B47CDD|nr:MULTISPECIES: FdhF/YdeP family oxidoreductase [unclassified Psychrobacter]MDN3452453.1 FdhF/YdeP family oxidoreductase [Psychrobacter sp. APC 3350]MDN3503660.1 FdhF/YdeP family oxidoreductase [Psychrobacter sp. 5A.1]